MALHTTFVFGTSASPSESMDHVAHPRGMLPACVFFGAAVFHVDKKHGFSLS